MTVIIQKPDLDTCLTALILRVSETDEVVISKGNASESDLMNPDVLCIEAGGSGLVHLNNFDHHEAARYLPPASRQAFEYTGCRDEGLERLTLYVCMVDEQSRDLKPIPFPSLSNLFSGMLLAVTDPRTQFFTGINMLQTVLEKQIDPFETVPITDEWQRYMDAKHDNLRHLQQHFQHARYVTSAQGLKIGFMETDAIGGINFLYSQGCAIAVLYNPHFGNPPIAKFTIAGNQIRVYNLKSIFEQTEPGWGGSETIIGSPRTGTTLLPEAVLEKIINNM